MSGAATLAPGELVARLRLLRTHGVGPISWHQMIRRFGSGAAALDALPDLMQRGGSRARPASASAVEDEIAATQRAGGRYVFADDPAFSPLLRQCEGAPPALIVKGDAALLARPAVAMVGARNASAAACRFARDIAARLVARDMVVVSGLARGIDTAAHSGAAAQGPARTIAVIASGIDRHFPPENERLQAHLAEQHLLVSEYPCGTEPLARQFPARNRIIAGLALGTVVIEAAPRSGSLITARRAGDFGREVMAVPGSPLDPRAQGCNQLIREGATLIQSADDILEAVAPLDRRMVREAEPAYLADLATGHVDADDQRRVVDLLGPTPVAVDELVRQSGAAPAAVQLALLELDLAGRIERHAGGRVSLI